MVKDISFALRSRPVGYAAEHLTRGRFPAIPMGSFPLMSFCCILYHFWDVRRILLPPPRQFRTPLATASRLDLQPRGICGLDRHRSFEFYRSSTSSSSTIVFNQQHRCISNQMLHSNYALFLPKLFFLPALTTDLSPICNIATPAFPPVVIVQATSLWAPPPFSLLKPTTITFFLRLSLTSPF